MWTLMRMAIVMYWTTRSRMKSWPPMTIAPLHRPHGLLLLLARLLPLEQLRWVRVVDWSRDQVLRLRRSPGCSAIWSSIISTSQPSARRFHLMYKVKHNCMCERNDNATHPDKRDTREMMRTEQLPVYCDESR